MYSGWKCFRNPGQSDIIIPPHSYILNVSNQQLDWMWDCRSSTLYYRVIQKFTKLKPITRVKHDSVSASFCLRRLSVLMLTCDTTSEIPSQCCDPFFPFAPYIPFTSGQEIPARHRTVYLLLSSGNGVMWSRFNAGLNTISLQSIFRMSSGHSYF